MWIRDVWYAIVIYRRSKPASRPAEYPSDAWPLWFVAYAFAP
jgi:hypothetical protein